MKQTKKSNNLFIGQKLYWSDYPDTLAGIIIGFTPKRDVIIDFVSGTELGKKNYSRTLASKFITK